MIILNSGIGLVVFGTPLLAIVLTIVVSLMETYYISRKAESFRTLFKPILLANITSTILGLVLIVILNFGDIFDWLRDWGISFKFSTGFGAYIARAVLLGVFYLITVLIEIPIIKSRLGANTSVKTKDILMANIVSYFLLGIVFYLMG